MCARAGCSRVIQRLWQEAGLQHHCGAQIRSDITLIHTVHCFIALTKHTCVHNSCVWAHLYLCAASCPSLLLWWGVLTKGLVTWNLRNFIIFLKPLKTSDLSCTLEFCLLWLTVFKWIYVLNWISKTHSNTQQHFQTCPFVCQRFLISLPLSRFCVL